MKNGSLAKFSPITIEKIEKNERTTEIIFQEELKGIKDLMVNN